jgi:hypothetical protein
MGTCTRIAVDFEMEVVEPNGRRRVVWDTRLFREDEEREARAFLAERQGTLTAAISKRMALLAGRRFRVEWVTDGGRVLCESEGHL